MAFASKVVQFLVLDVFLMHSGEKTSNDAVSDETAYMEADKATADGKSWGLF